MNALEVATESQDTLLAHFYYLDDLKRFGLPELFDHAAQRLIDKKIIYRDCDGAARSMTERIKILKLIDLKFVLEMVTPNHYIAGIIDKKLKDVYVIENTAWIFTKKAAEAGVENFEAIIAMPTYEKYRQGYIKAAIYKLSDLQKGVQEPDIITDKFIIRGRFKKYYMESFRLLTDDITIWKQSQSDLPFLKDFIEVRDIEVPAAEYGYKFTKEWENSFCIECFGHARFEDSFELLRGLEFTNPKDILHQNEGEKTVTFYGIYKHQNKFWRGWHIVDKAIKKYKYLYSASAALSSNAELITLVKEHYIKEYWNKMKLNQLHSQKMADEMFIFAINNNRYRAVRFAQKIVGTKADGIIGPITIKALNSFDVVEFDKLYDESEIRFYAKLAKRNFARYGRFLLGWINRAFSV